MNHFLIPILIGIIGAIIIYRDAKPPKKKRSQRLVTFHEHVNELSDIISRCNSRAEWSVLDIEINHLEDTWCGRIEEGILQTECGKLTTKWLDRKKFIEPPIKSPVAFRQN